MWLRGEDVVEALEAMDLAADTFEEAIRPAKEFVKANQPDGWFHQPDKPEPSPQQEQGKADQPQNAQPFGSPSCEPSFAAPNAVYISFVIRESETSVAAARFSHYLRFRDCFAMIS